MIYSPLNKHLFIIEDQNGRRTIALEEDKYSVGRRSENQIMIYSTQASRHHATLVRKTNSKNQEYSYWILDGNLEGDKSQNGIYVNGQKCLVHELKDGDLINFGCDVNASYHQINNAFEIPVKSVGSPRIETTEPDLEKYPILQAQLYQKPDSVTCDHSETSNGMTETIVQQTYLDPLTQLPTAKLFNEHLSLAINNSKKTRKILAVFLLEIENLVRINQKLDNHNCDQLIQEFAKKIKGSLRAGDIVARIKEDKFAVLLPQINITEDARTITQRILTNIKAPIEVNEQPILLRSNIGISTYPKDGSNGTNLLEKAANHLENNKQNNYQLTLVQKTISYNQNSQFLQIEKLLYEAIENEEFSLYYQPQVNIETGEIEGLEALLRWQHPRYGLITPGKFLPVAEKTDLIIPITQWVLKTACQQNKEWMKLGAISLPVSVNISSRLFQSPYLSKMLIQVLAQTGLEGRLLELEITEDSIFDNVAESLQILQAIQRMDVKISLDDFGLGYASLSYLSQLPIKKLKIAQTLIQELKHHPQKTALVSAIIAAGQIFAWQVVAKGVETQQQLELLQALNCNQMQGNRFSQPLTVTEATQFLSLHRTLIGDQLT